MDASILRIVRIALGIISDRLLTILAMCMTFALAVYVMYFPTYERMGMAAFFALFVFMPLAIKERKNEGRQRDKELDG